MRAVRQHAFGGVEVLDVEAVDRPEPGSGEVLVEIRAAGVNPTDTYYRAGLIGDAYGGLAAPDLPMTLGSDFAGVVAEVGERVRSFEVGDRVFGTGMHTGLTQQGSYAEYAAVPQELVATLPSSVGFVAGGAVGLAGVTAWRALVDYGRLAPGETCLVHGGSGGVGHLAVQLGRLAGATVIATAGSSVAQRRIRELGAVVVIDYGADDLPGEIDAAAPAGCDVILDHRLDDYADLDVDVAAFGARIVNIGGAGGRFSAGPLARAKELTLHFMTVANLVERPGLPRIASVLDHLAALLENGSLRVEVAHEYALAEVREAHRALEEEHVVGKLVIVP